MKKQIEFEVVGILDNHIAFKVSEQTHRNSEFGENGESDFTASNGVLLWSSNFPMLDEKDHTIFVRGLKSENDDTVLVCTKEFYKKCIEAEIEYNEHFSNTKKLDYYKVVFFKYEGGTNFGGYRRVGVFEQNNTHIYGVDLDQDDQAYRTYSLDKIIGKIHEVK